MKVLIAHNAYGKYSGEEAVVDRIAAILAAHGDEVCRYERTTAGVRESLRGKVRSFFAGIYSPDGVRGMREALEREQPDVVNVHNVFPWVKHGFKLISKLFLTLKRFDKCVWKRAD